MSNWTDGLLFGTSAASAGDDELRSFMTQLASGISASFNWPGSGGGSLASAGESKLGNARTAHSGNVAGGYPNGFLSFNTAHASLHHIGVAPALLGHSSMVDYNPAGVLPNSEKWLTQQGTISIGGLDPVNSTKTVTFPTAYATAPVFLQMIVLRAASIGLVIHPSTITAGGFVSAYTNLTGSPAAATILWESVGSVLL